MGYIPHPSVLVFVTIYLNAFGIIPPTHGGFRCEDDSIKFKFQGDTFPTVWLVVLSFIPLLLMVSYYYITCVVTKPLFMYIALG